MVQFDVWKSVEIKIVIVDENGKRWDLKPNDVGCELRNFAYNYDPKAYTITGPFTQPKEDFPAGVPPVKD